MGVIFDQNELRERLTLKNGGKWDFWLTHVSLVESYIKKNKMRPINHEHLAMSQPQIKESTFAAKAEKQVFVLYPIPFPGGIKYPHFHFEGNIYEVSPELWKSFTKEVVLSLTDKLRTAGKIPYDGLMEISETIGSYC